MTKPPEKITATHIYFWGSIFSNWFPVTFEYKGHSFDNSEQAFMWEKAMFFNDQEIATKILNTPNPRKNKKLGRAVKNFDATKWEAAAFDIMVAVNLAKWTVMKQELLATADKILVEASPLDKVWGVGLSADNPLILDKTNWEGRNLLGEALMKVRELLKD